MPKLVVMLRIKDGIQFVEDWLTNISPLVDEIVVVDNGSTDGTYEILQQHSKVIVIERTQGFDEGRDKILAYKKVRERKPDWVLWLDVDEVFEERVTRKSLDRLMKSKVFTRFFLRRFHMIDEGNFNMSSFWINHTCFPSRILWKEQPTGYFDDLKFNNGLIRGVSGLPRVSHFRIKHLGYVNKELVQQKADLYRSIDSSLENTYQQMWHTKIIAFKWHEYLKSPVRVTIMNLLMDFYYYAMYLPIIPSRVARFVSSRLAIRKSPN